MYNTALAGLGQSEARKLASKRCWAVVENTRKAEKNWRGNFAGGLWSLPIWPLKCGGRGPLSESHASQCHGIDNPNFCLDLKEEEKKEAARKKKEKADARRQKFEAEKKRRGDARRRRGGGPSASTTQSTKGGLFIERVSNGEARVPATAPRKVDVAFSYSGGDTKGIQQELEQRLKLADRGFISRPQKGVKVITGPGYISKR